MRNYVVELAYSHEMWWNNGTFEKNENTEKQTLDSEPKKEENKSKHKTKPLMILERHFEL